jgi:hypothetical protein
MIHGRRMLPTATATPRVRQGEENDASGASYLKVEKRRIAGQKSGKRG